jgi:hypothetical protein
METTTATKYIVKGSNGDETACACCGRNDLERVVWLAPLDADGNEGKAQPYGTTCAGRLISPKNARGVAGTLVKVSKAMAFVAKWADSEYSLEDIRNAVEVKFNVWANVEDSTLFFNLETGRVAVLTR